MSSKIAMTPLMKQFWIYGALPLLCLYGLNLFLISRYFRVVFSDDCVFFPDSCPSDYKPPIDFYSPTFFVVTLIMFGLTALNAYRVFRLSRNEANGRAKFGVRLAVFLVPAFAIVLFYPLALKVI